MPGIESIKKNKDFRRVYIKGVFTAGESMILYVKKRKGKGEQGKRFGFTVSKKVGKAVVRNKVKRLYKEACRKYLHCFPEGNDYVIIAKKGAADDNFQVISEKILKLLQRVIKKI